MDALKSRWPISLHWGIEDASFSKIALKETEQFDEWVKSQEKAGKGASPEERAAGGSMKISGSYG